MRGDELALLARSHACALRAMLAGGLAHGAAFDCALRWQAGLRRRLDGAEMQARLLVGEPAEAAPARGLTRAGLLHLRALQACDAADAGASQRDIAQALLGDAAVRGHWHADGELRAQVRHLLRRARVLLDGGYLVLAGVIDVLPRAAANADAGDERRH